MGLGGKLALARIAQGAAEGPLAVQQQEFDLLEERLAQIARRRLVERQQQGATRRSALGAVGQEVNTAPGVSELLRLAGLGTEGAGTIAQSRLSRQQAETENLQARTDLTEARTGRINALLPREEQLLGQEIALNEAQRERLAALTEATELENDVARRTRDVQVDLARTTLALKRAQTQSQVAENEMRPALMLAETQLRRALSKRHLSEAELNELEGGLMQAQFAAFQRLGPLAANPEFAKMKLDFAFRTQKQVADQMQEVVDQLSEEERSYLTSLQNAATNPLEWYRALTTTEAPEGVNLNTILTRINELQSSNLFPSDGQIRFANRILEGFGGASAGPGLPQTPPSAGAAGDRPGGGLPVPDPEMMARLRDAGAFDPGISQQRQREIMAEVGIRDSEQAAQINQFVRMALEMMRIFGVDPEEAIQGGS